MKTTLALLLMLLPAPSIVADDLPPLIGPSGMREPVVGTAPSPFPAGTDIPLGGTNEPTIAARGNIVVYASLSQMRISTNGGASFGLALFAPVPTGYYRNGDSSLGFDSQGRLFWTYIGGRNDESGWDLFIAQVDPLTRTVLPGYPVNITDSPGVGLPGSSGLAHDKPWVAVDAHASSPYADRIYVTWTEFSVSQRVLVTWSGDQGMTWNTAVQLSTPSEGFPWPAHCAVAPNGDAYVGYHAQPGWLASAPDGVSGRIYVARSTDGGVTYPQKTMAYLPGEADMTFNVQTTPAVIPGAQFWLQGSVQPWILPDPFVPGRIFVVANDDPDNDNTSGDAADVFINQSNDNGMNWGSPRRIDSGPGTTFQVMPTASIDPESGIIAVQYYDNRAGLLNPSGHYLLDVFMTSTIDATYSFLPDGSFNDVSFDPDRGAPIRFSGPPATYRIGEYTGTSVSGDVAYSVWCGNTLMSQQSIFDSVVRPGRTSVPQITGRGIDRPRVDPNPFARDVSILYELPADSAVRLTIYDVMGREVARLVDGRETFGQHKAVWSAGEAGGSSATPPGVYFARLQAGDTERITKLVLAP